MAKPISWSQPDWACISLAEDKTKGRQTHKQTTTEVSCSKGLAKHHKGGNCDVHEFQTQGSHCLQRILNKALKINILFMIIFICPSTFEPLKMEGLCIKMFVIPKLLCYIFFFVLFCFVLFCFVLFCFVLFCFVLFCFVLFCFVLFCFVLFCFVLFCYVMLCYVMLWAVMA